MRRMNILILTVLFMLSTSRIASAKEWRGIVPLYSTRNDVERLLGISPTGGGYGYEFKNERVFFQYQYPDSQCGKKWGRWNVQINTVLGVSVHPKSKNMFIDLGLDLSKFVRLESCSPGGYSYYNAMEGITYSTEEGFIGESYYGPTVKDEFLLCPETTKSL